MTFSLSSPRSRSLHFLSIFSFLLAVVRAQEQGVKETASPALEDVKTIFTFTYQSQSNGLTEWYGMITICLTPLVTHVVFGLAKAVYLTHIRAPTIECFALGNPISILWRYYAIADRRLRALSWDNLDLAASNTIFWDGSHWNGSEQILYQSRKWIIRTPEKSHTSIVSISGFATIAVTLQGMQAVSAAISGLLPDGTFGIQDGLPGLFLPLAVVGLLRVQASPWVTADFEYGDECKDRFYKQLTTVESNLSEYESQPYAPITIKPESDLLHRISSARFVSNSSWRGVLFRIWWLMSIAFMCGIMTMVCFHGILFDKSNHQDGIFIVTASQLAQRILFMIMIWSALIIHAIYVVRGKNTTTVIPCIQSTWYKVFTILLYTAMIGCFVIDAFESKITACGRSTTFPPYFKMESNKCALSP